MAKAKKKEALSLEEKIEQALVPVDEQPYEVPGNWCWVKLDNLCNDIIVPQRDKPKKFGGEIPWCRIEDIEGKYLNDTLSNQYVTKETVDEMNLRVCPKGTVICSCSASLGIQAILTRECCTNQTFIGLVCNEQLLNNEYLYYYLMSLDQYFQTIGTGTTIKYISRNKFEQLNIPVPNLDEQQRIVEQIESLFARLDEAKEKVQSVIDSYEIRRAAILQKVFKEAIERSVIIKECPLSEIAEIVSGYAFSSNSFMETGGIPCIKITNVGVKRFMDEEFQYLPTEFLNEYEKFVVRENDILISLTRSFINAGLKVCIYNQSAPALLNQRVALIRNCNREYIYYYLQTDEVLQYVKSKSKTTNQPNLSIKDLNALTIPCLSDSEEENVVKQINKLLKDEERFMEVITRVDEEIDLIKKSILAKAFRGELGTNNLEEQSSTELLKTILLQERAYRKIYFELKS